MAGKSEDTRKIRRDELKSKIDGGDRFVLLETLAPEEFRQAHLPGAINMPASRVGELASTVIPDKETEVVTYCSGPRCDASTRAARELQALGYANVLHYAGGKQDWSAAGLPVESGA